MRKLLICLLLLVSLFGCASNNSNKNHEESMQKYAAYYKSVLDNDAFLQNSNYFDIEVVMNELPNNQYRYDVLIDNPKLAMYDIETIVIENNLKYGVESNAMPSLGVFDSQEYSLIPYQVYVKDGYMKGLISGGIIDSKQANIKIMVTWKDYAKLNQTREFFEFNIDFDAYNATHDTGDAPANPTATPEA